MPDTNEVKIEAPGVYRISFEKWQFAACLEQALRKLGIIAHRSSDCAVTVPLADERDVKVLQLTGALPLRTGIEAIPPDKCFYVLESLHQDGKFYKVFELRKGTMDTPHLDTYWDSRIRYGVILETQSLFIEAIQPLDLLDEGKNKEVKTLKGRVLINLRRPNLNPNDQEGWWEPEGNFILLAFGDKVKFVVPGKNPSNSSELEYVFGVSF